MIKASIAYSTSGHARITQLCARHKLNIVELFESLAFADDQVVAAAVAQGLPRRKEKMAANKKTISAARRAFNSLTAEQIAIILESQTVKA